MEVKSLTCAGCGAQLPVSAGEGVIPCTFCGTRNMLVPKAQSVPGYAEPSVELAVRQIKNDLWKIADETITELLRREPENGNAWLLRAVIDHPFFPVKGTGSIEQSLAKAFNYGAEEDLRRDMSGFLIEASKPYYRRMANLQAAGMDSMHDRVVRNCLMDAFEVASFCASTYSIYPDYALVEMLIEVWTHFGQKCDWLIEAQNTPRPDLLKEYTHYETSQIKEAIPEGFDQLGHLAAWMESLVLTIQQEHPEWDLEALLELQNTQLSKYQHATEPAPTAPPAPPADLPEWAQVVLGIVFSILVVLAAAYFSGSLDFLLKP